MVSPMDCFMNYYTVSIGPADAPDPAEDDPITGPSSRSSRRQADYAFDIGCSRCRSRGPLRPRSLGNNVLLGTQYKISEITWTVASMAPPNQVMPTCDN